MPASQELSPEDRRLWQAAADGDAAARQQLCERAWSVCAFRLRRFAAADREELAQCIAASVLRALATGIAPRCNLDGMLEWRGRAEITRFVRGAIRARRFEALDEALEQAGHGPAPYDTVAADELRRLLVECIDSVPSRHQREALRRRWIDGLSPAEISALQTVRAELVRVWLSRAAAAVRECLHHKLPDSRDP